jgi:hypothetical protein
METWMAGGIGRVLTGYDEMVFRTMVRDSSYFYEFVGLQSEGTAIDFQIGQMAYLYGTRFFSYLAYVHGPEKLLDWVRRDNGSCRYFSSQFQSTYGTSLDDEWSRWIEFEHAWQETNLDSIRKYPPTEYRVLSRRALGSVSREFYDPERRVMYAAVNFPGEFAHIASISVDSGKIEKLCEIPTPALYYVCSLAYDDSTSTLFFTTDNSRSLRDLNALDIESKKTRVLFKNCRTGDLVFNRADRSIWGVQHHNGHSALVRFPPPYNDGYEILVLAYGKDIFDIDISPDGWYLTGTLAEISGRQQLIRMETEKLLSWDSSYEVLWEFVDNNAANFVFSDDGRYLFGTSYYSGASNVFRYDFTERAMEALSNVEAGFFRPLPVSDDSLIVFRYTGDGFVPVMIANEAIEDVCPVRYLGQAVVDKHPVVKEWKLGSPMDIDLDTLITSKEEFSGLTSLDLTSAYPIAEAYKNYAGFGMRFNLMDPMWHNSLDFALSYSPATGLPDDERFHARFQYQNWRWTIRGDYNLADFYDFFGPTKLSRKGHSLSVKFKGYPLVDKPRYLEYTLGIAGYGGLERVPDYQNVDVSFEELYTGTAHLQYKNLRKTIGGVEHEKGVVWNLSSINNYVNGEIFPRILANFDYGLLLPIDHSSVWLRTSFGVSFGERDEPFANFYFGGFGNNWIDHAEVDRYREYYAFPGAELNEIGGINYGKAMLEWTLPPIRFRRVGVPAVYANWIRCALFASGVVTNIDSEVHRRRLVNIGAQTNLKIVFFSSLESTLSLGYAVAGEEETEPKREFMISLKILR